MSEIGKQPKIIAFYLPQYHEIEENNKWWGKGFTEWVNVKRAKALYAGHNQPRIPLNDNYYNLLDDNIKKWQIGLAKEYGIYGFCIYHYWFGGHLLLEKPVEQFLENKDLNIPFCLCWANENWTTQWVDSKAKIIFEQKYGDKGEWKKHFEYFLPFFKDDRYIKEDNKPLLVIYRPDIIHCLNEMLDYWNELAIETGFSGIAFANQYSDLEDIRNSDSRFKYHIEYQPLFARKWKKKKGTLLCNKLSKEMKKFLNVILPWRDWTSVAFVNMDFKEDYDKVWNAILQHKPVSNKCIPGAFVDWDNTPRKGDRGTIYQNASPEKFELYFDKLVKKSKLEYENDYIFIFAWNEWGEGGYLEPDQKNKFGYLEAIKNVMEKYANEC